jgi:FAD synthase
MSRFIKSVVQHMRSISKKYLPLVGEPECTIPELEDHIEVLKELESNAYFVNAFTASFSSPEVDNFIGEIEKVANVNTGLP